MNNREMTEQEERWQVESDLWTLTEADRIRADKGRMADVKAMAKEQVQALQRVAGASSGGAAPGPKTEVMSGIRVTRTKKGE